MVNIIDDRVEEPYGRKFNEDTSAKLAHVPIESDD